MHILLVDDESDIVELIAHQLERRGHQVTTAGCGDDAVALMDQHKFDLVFSDILMPDGNGMKVYARAKELNTEVIFISGYGQSYHSILPSDVTVIEKFEAVAGNTLDQYLATSSESA